MKCSLRFEKALRAQGGCEVIAGVDEAGRGPLAGPVVVAAVILPPKFRHRTLTDSKQLTANQREEVFEDLMKRGDLCWAVSIAENDEIDRFNILQATHQSMRRAVNSLSVKPDHALIDGLPVKNFPVAQTAIVAGDAQSYSIAAASVIAKVTRDRIMTSMDQRFPGYEFFRHKGYGTALHLQRLRAYGPCAIHRRSFLPVRQALLPL